MVMGNFTEQILVDTARVMSQERSVINGYGGPDERHL